MVAVGLEFHAINNGYTVYFEKMVNLVTEDRYILIDAIEIIGLHTGMQ